MNFEFHFPPAHVRHEDVDDAQEVKRLRELHVRIVGRRKENLADALESGHLLVKRLKRLKHEDPRQRIPRGLLQKAVDKSGISMVTAWRYIRIAVLDTFHAERLGGCSSVGEALAKWQGLYRNNSQKTKTYKTLPPEKVYRRFEKMIQREWNDFVQLAEERYGINPGNSRDPGFRDLEAVRRLTLEGRNAMLKFILERENYQPADEKEE
jgi:hypothetical protein